MHHQAVWKSTVVRRLGTLLLERKIDRPARVSDIYRVEATTVSFADFTVSLQILLYLKQFQDYHGKTSSSFFQRDARNVLAAAARPRFYLPSRLCYRLANGVVCLGATPIERLTPAVCVYYSHAHSTYTITSYSGTRYAFYAYQ